MLNKILDTIMKSSFFRRASTIIPRYEFDIEWNRLKERLESVIKSKKGDDK